jgi:D-serine dehydratase
MDFSQPISVDGATTPVGLIARLEHALDRMEADLDEHHRRVVDAKARLAGYEPRLGEVFPLQGELDGKLVQIADIVANLACSGGAP